MIVGPAVRLWKRTWLTRTALIVAASGILLALSAIGHLWFVRPDMADEAARMVPVQLLMAGECTLVLAIALMFLARRLGHTA